MVLTSLLFGAFGLIVGSFLNVVILRSGVGSLTGRSSCMSCGAQIRAYDLVPVFSWLLLRGKCRACGSGISIQYPLVELATALLFALIGGAPFPVGMLYRALFCIIIAILIAITVYDFRHTIIPDAWAYTFAGMSFFVMGPLLMLLSPPGSDIVFYLFAGPIAASPLFFLWAISQGRWMGLGDVKLAFGIGWLLGPVPGIFSVMAAFVLGALIMVPLLLVTRISESIGKNIRCTPLENKEDHVFTTILQNRYAQIVNFLRLNSLTGLTMKSEVPFGPFLIASCLIVWFMFLYFVPVPIPFFE